MRSRHFREQKDEGKDPLWKPKWESAKIMKEKENKKINALSSKEYKRMARLNFVKWFKNIGQKNEVVVDESLAKRIKERQKKKCSTDLITLLLF